MSRRRGFCPSLSTPMETGDGLLVRLSPPDGRLSSAQLAALAVAAGRHGNGVLEITARGNLQIRGLATASVAALAAETEELGITSPPGVSVQAGPLAGLAGDEIADPRPLAEAIRKGAAERGLATRLGPKVSVTVDGGGTLHLGGLVADVKLEGSGEGQRPVVWRVSAGGRAAEARTLGRFSAEGAVAVILLVLETLARKGRTARARDLADEELGHITGAGIVEPEPARRSARAPVGRFALAGGGWARGLGLAYGQIESPALAALAVACGEREIRLAPGRGLLVLPFWGEDDAILCALAERLGLVVHPDDPRLSIAACAGAPACASAHLATRRLADALARRRPGLLDGRFTLHLSGCGKECARPPAPSVTLAGRAGGCDIRGDGLALPEELRRTLAELAEEFREGSPA